MCFFLPRLALSSLIYCAAKAPRLYASAPDGALKIAQDSETTIMYSRCLAFFEMRIVLWAAQISRCSVHNTDDTNVYDALGK